MKYRTDIDGLRAVAVIPVVLFHAGVTAMAGGFVGVDVFFVISGYLITGLILNDMADERFSILSFYERRARRILPALFTVLLAVVIATYALLLPDRAQAVGQSLFATVFFSSNFVFWKQTGYFQALEVKPLLHTWSLAVEEQFYIVFPLFLFIVGRYLRKQFLLAVLTVFAFSFVFALWAVKADRSLAFFLAPGRAWELLLGALLAIGAIPPLRHRVVANMMGLFGLVLLSYSFVVLSGGASFPGANALYPTLGAALVIYSGTARPTIVTRCLSSPPLVFIGLISYSLYLWHWIVFVFFKYYLNRALTRWEIAEEIAASLVIATLSWKFVEGPFRGRQGQRRFSRRWVFAGAALGSAILAFSGGILYLKHGFPSRFNKKVLELYAGKNDRWKRHDECWTKICHVGDDSAPPSFLLWGDSHAGAIAPVFEQAAASSKVSGFVAFKGACAPLLGLKRYDEADVEQCARFHESVLALIESEHIRNVFLHGRWGLYSEGVRYKQEGGTPALITAKGNPTANYSEFEKLLRTTISELRRRNLNVVIIASVPEVGTDVPTELAREAARGTTVDPGPRYSDFMERQARTFRLFSRVAAESAVEVIYPHQLLCDVVSCSIVKAEHALYVDDNHLSVHGAMYLAPLVTPLVKEAAMATRGNGTLSLEAIVILKGLYFP